MSSQTPLKKTSISSSNSCQLELGSCLGVNILCPPPALGGTGSPDGLDLSKSCACCHGICEFRRVSVLLCVEDTVSTLLSILSGSYKLPAFCSAQYTEPQGLEGFMETPHLGLNILKVSYSEPLY